MKTVDKIDPGWIRPAAVAGTWYPGERESLTKTIDGFLAAVDRVDGDPLALIVPHAGYVYSGKVAAAGFKQLEGGDYQTVVVVAADHYPPVSRPVSVWGHGAFETPLGLVPVDEETAQALVAYDSRITCEPETHTREHAIEIELPFIQRLLPKCKIVPILMGASDAETVEVLAGALADALGGKRAMIVASSDLSHFPPAEEARRIDLDTLDGIETGDSFQVRKAIRAGMGRGVPGLATCACGEGPILAAWTAAQKMGADTFTVLEYANSGDLPGGDRSRVVGYGAAMAWRYRPPQLGQLQRERLLHLARHALKETLETGVSPKISEPEDPSLERRAGVFLTLRSRGELRGCIGHLKADRPLYRVVPDTAVSAALHDPRFPPLMEEELEASELKISVLSPMKRVLDAASLQLGVHGVLVARQDRRGVLLPSVPIERGWGRETFLENASLKAGLPADAWKTGAKVYAFTTIEFGDGDLPFSDCFD